MGVFASSDSHLQYLVKLQLSISKDKKITKLIRQHQFLEERFNAIQQVNPNRFIFQYKVGEEQFADLNEFTARVYERFAVNEEKVSSIRKQLKAPSGSRQQSPSIKRSSRLIKRGPKVSRLNLDKLADRNDFDQNIDPGTQAYPSPSSQLFSNEISNQISKRGMLVPNQSVY